MSDEDITGNTEYSGLKGEKPVNEVMPGQIVSLKSDPSVHGVITSIIPGMPENRLQVFINGNTQTFYASQIQPVDEDSKELSILTCSEFQSYLTALQIRNPGLSTLYSLNSARIDFIPYQFRPVLKFIRSDRPRLLIADGVGVGKTIEAGLILREIQARSDVKSILIICPRPLVTENKWRNEMKRFEERFTHLDGPTLRFCINEMDLDGAWPDQHQKSIIPYSLFDEALLYGIDTSTSRKKRKGLLDLDPPPRFDLVIVDEAHHIRNQDTYSHKAVRFFCDHAEAVLFLTATPIQLGSHDLFVLLNVLRPDLIIDVESFEHMAEPNPFINQAVNIARSQHEGWASDVIVQLSNAASTSWGTKFLQQNPEFQRILTQLTEGEVTQEERIQLISDLEALHTFGGIISRTRRRDIGDFTLRKPETVNVEFTSQQKDLHDKILEIQAEIFSQMHGDINVNFMMTTIRRQAASCLYGLTPFLKDILNRHIDELMWDEADNSQEVPLEMPISEIESKIRTILELAQNLDPIDPKLEALKSIIRDKQNLKNNKVILFSSFRHTLYYIHKHLLHEGFRVGLVHGGTPDEERLRLRSKFEQNRESPDSLDTILFSEIGCEGLDYQFCDCMVNYDLPWNPMRIEQRIGRIDRIGQKSDTVVIFNLITPGTVDADIYDRCMLRIGVFNNALGGSEEILGNISSEIRNIAENFSLSDDDRRLKFDQLADNHIRLIQEQNELEDKQVELFGLRLPEDQMQKEIDKASNFWLTPDAILNLVKYYLQVSCGKDQEYILGEKPVKTLRLSLEDRNRLLCEYQQLPRKTGSVSRDWEQWLKGDSPHLSITFEASTAKYNTDATFLMPLHPLVRQASQSFRKAGNSITFLRVHSETIPEGCYDFVIYQWKYLGFRDDLILSPVASSEEVTRNLLELLQRAKEDTSIKEIYTDLTFWDNLESKHYEIWSNARKEHRDRTSRLADYRKESLETSHNARMALLNEQFEQANDDKIRRMRQSQMSAAESDFNRRIVDLNKSVEQADISAMPMAYGLIRVLGGS